MTPPDAPVASSRTLPNILILIALFGLAALLIRLEPPMGTLEGQVVGPKGQPVAGAMVSVDLYPRNFEIKVDDQGKFVSPQIPVGEYYFNVRAKGFQPYYAPKRVNILEGKVTQMGAIALQELPPSFYLETWEETKLPDEKFSLNMSGAKVNQVHFTAYRVDLMQFLEKGGLLSDLQNREADVRKLPALTQVKDWIEEVPKEDVVEFSRRVKFPLEGKGFFLLHAVAASTDRTQTFTHNMLVNKTDLGFVAKRDEYRILVFASTFLKPQPAEGAKVYLFYQGKKAGEAVTGADGTAALSLEGLEIPASEAPVLVAERGEDQALLQGPTVYLDDYSEEGGEGEEGEAEVGVHPKVFLYTERPLYRPGQKVFFKGIARTETTDGGYGVAANEAVQVTVTNPKGDVLLEESLTTNAFGSFSASLDLDEEGGLGYYNIAAVLQGKEFTKEFEVEEYRKPEFKVEILPDKPRYYPGDKITFTIDTQFYFGAPMEAEVEYTIYQSPYYYSGPDDEVFDYFHYGYESVGGYGEYLKDGKVRTDANGKATVVLEAPKTEQDVRITLRATAKDLTERIVTKENDAYVVGGDFYFRTKKTQFLGRVGQPFPMAVLTRDYEGKPVSRDFEVTAEREKWDPLSYSYRYSKASKEAGKTGADGQGQVTLKFEQGGYYRLAIRGKDEAGRKVLFYDYLWVSGATQDEEGFGMEKNLILVADKKKFQAGESVKLFLVGPVKDGKVLLTVEGAKIHDHQVVQLNGFSKEVEIPLKKEWIPNVFIAASAIGKKEYYESSVEVAVSPAEHYLTVQVESNAPRYQPGQEIIYQITTKDAAGNPVPAEVSLGVVDESLYALKEDHTNIKEFFWGPRPNRVGSNYSFSGYYSGGIEKEDQRLLRKNFKDTAFWNPSVVTDATGRAEVKFQLPDNLTTWRATAVAQTLDTQVGQQIQKIIATKDLIVRLAIPRFFTQRDRVILKALVQNYSEQEQTLQATLGLKGLAFASAQDEKPRTLTVPSQKTVSFEVEVLAKETGQATVQFLAKNDKLSDGFELKIPVLPYGIEDHQFHQGEIHPGSGPASLALNLPPQVAQDSARLSVTVDSSLFAQLLGPVSYLVQYPYGCVEQTTSRMLAALTVADLFQSLGISDATLEKKIPKVVAKGIKRVTGMQHSDGGWGWWKDDANDPYMTAYALYGLMRAAQLGQKVDEEVLKKGKEALANMLLAGTGNLPQYSLARDEENRYFMHYVASLAGIKNNPPIPQGKPIGSKLGQAYLILALELQGRHVQAVPLMETLKRDLICTGGLCHVSDGKPSYVGDAEVTAWVLRAFLQAAPEDAASIQGMVKWLMADRKGGFWRQTRETAAAIYALSDYARSLPTTQAGVKFLMTLNGAELAKINVASPHFVRKLGPLDLREGENRLELLNQADHTLFYQTDLTYYSVQDPLLPVAKGVEVRREYVRLKGERNPSTSEVIYQASELKGAIAKGETIGVRLTVSNGEPISFVVIEDPLPAGFEVVEGVRFDKDAAYYTEKEVHDEKVAMFMTYLHSGKHVFNYGIRPELPGWIYAMPTQASEMYVPEVRGSSESMKLEVK